MPPLFLLPQFQRSWPCPIRVICVIRGKVLVPDLGDVGDSVRFTAMPTLPYPPVSTQFDPSRPETTQC